MYWDKETGTAKATSFVVFAIDRANKKVNAYIFGAGKNRAVAYDGTYVPAIYTVTNTLSNVTGASGNPSTIAEFGTASLTFTANEGYELPSSVTVSGAEHTWDKATGVLALSDPIGNVTVTIEAVALPSYTNQIPISTDTDGSIYNSVGYREGYRMNASTGAEEANASYDSTGFIPIGYGSSNAARDEQVIRLQGITAAVSTSTRIFLYKADKSFIGTQYATNFKLKADDDGTVATLYEADAAGNITYIDFTGITSMMHNQGNDAAYFRISCQNIDGSSIITVNEPIE